jgi:hypothetical protein
MKFTGHFTGAKLDLNAYQSRLREHLTSELQRVTEAWLQATTGRVPVWSGMARGSLQKVAEAIGKSIVIRNLVKSRIALGRQLGIVEPTYGPTEFTMAINLSVPHYTLQEFTNVGVSKSAPWRSFDAGALAYREAVRSVILPQLIYIPIKIKVA